MFDQRQKATELVTSQEVESHSVLNTDQGPGHTRS